MQRNTRLAAGILLVSGLLLLGPRLACADEDAAAQLVRRAFDNLPKVTFKADLLLTPSRGEKSEIWLRHKMVGGARASNLEVVSPEPLRGVRMLFLEHPGGEPEQYLKLSLSARVVRVSGEIRKNPFLGSDFYVSDLVEPEFSAFSYEFVDDATVNGRSVKRVRATPRKPDDEIYGSTIFAIDPTDLLIVQREFFDRRGKPSKVWTVDEVERVDGIATIRKQRMKDIQAGTESLLESRDVDYHAELPDEIFTPDHLKR